MRSKITFFHREKKSCKTFNCNKKAIGKYGYFVFT